MGLLHPAAMLALVAALPALVLAYLARERPARVTVSSVLAFRALRGPRAERFGGRPRFNWMFFVELLIVTLAVLAIASPYATTTQRPIAAVLDNSASMRARMSSGLTRFDEARNRISSALAEESGAAPVTLFVSAPQPHRLRDPFDSVSAARSALGHLEAADAPLNRQALARMLGELASGGHFSGVIFAGSSPLEPPIPPRIRAIAIGAPIPNGAIGSFVLRRESFGAETLRARLTVANFSGHGQTLQIAITGDGRALGNAQAHFEPGEIGAIEFPSLKPAQVYRAELSPSDDFPLDNVAYATAGGVKPAAILFVSPTPGDAAGLSGLPGVSVRTEPPDRYSPVDLANIDLAIFEYTIPKQLPSVNSLLVMPPAGDPVFGFTVTQSDSVEIAQWRTPDPLTDNVNFRLIQPRRGEYFVAHPWMAAAVSGDSGALLLTGERQGHRFVATGFNPFPYLGRKNLPMSVLTLNLLSHLAGLSSDTSGYRTGEPWMVPAGITRIVMPSGHEIDVKPGRLFWETSEQGVYKLISADGSSMLRAVNLANLSISDLRGVQTLRIETSGHSASTSGFARRISLQGWLLAAILALAIAEAVGAYRRRRPMVQAPS